MRTALTLTDASEEIITEILDAKKCISRSQVLSKALEASLMIVQSELQKRSVSVPDSVTLKLPPGPPPHDPAQHISGPDTGRAVAGNPFAKDKPFKWDGQP